MTTDASLTTSNMGRQSIPPTGLTVVVNPEKPSLDIVFVHGFTGHPVRTWTHTKGDVDQQIYDESEIAEPVPKKPKLGLFSKSRVCLSPVSVVSSMFARFTLKQSRADRDTMMYGLSTSREVHPNIQRDSH